MTERPKVRTCLWFERGGLEAARFYVSLLPGSAIEAVHAHGRENDPMVVEFTLAGAPMMILSAGPHYRLTPAASISVLTKDQPETDRLWAALLGAGGAESRCGWLVDRFGVSWQIVPEVLPRLLSHPDPAAAARARDAMMQMGRIDIAALEAAVRGAAKITVEARVAAPLPTVWRAYTTPADIVQWNAASDDWRTTAATVDLRVGGAFASRMEAKDGSSGFDFAGVYTRIVTHERLEYDFGGRKADVTFAEGADGVVVRVTFDAETTHAIAQQRDGWQAILDRFARHVEARYREPDPEANTEHSSRGET